MKKIYESIISKESILLLNEINNSKIIRMNRDNDFYINDIYVKLVIFTSKGNIEIGVDIKYSKEYDEFTKITVKKTKEEEISINGKMEEVTMNQNIKNIYIYRDIVELSENDVLVKDRGLIFELEEYSMGYFVSDYSPSTFERIDFLETDMVCNIYPTIKEYKNAFEDKIISYKRERIYIKDLVKDFK